jgi:hypothetical protein
LPLDSAETSPCAPAAFPLENGVVYHIYSAYSRGLDGLWRMYQWLDRASKGSNETGGGPWWRATTNGKRLAKTGGRLIKHARYYWLLLAESHLTRQLFAGMLRKIAELPLPTG